MFTMIILISKLCKKPKRISDSDLLTIQELSYYMDAAYKRIIEACKEVGECLEKSDQIIETALFKLDVLIDNVSFQLNEADRRFPNEHKNILEDSLRNMKSDFNDFVKQAPFGSMTQKTMEQFSSSADRFKKVLNLEAVPFTSVSRDEVDPSTMVEPVKVFSSHLVQSKKDISSLGDARTATILRPQSSWK